MSPELPVEHATLACRSRVGSIIEQASRIRSRIHQQGRSLQHETIVTLLTLGSQSEDAVNIADLSLDFTLPGYDLELRVCFHLLSIRRPA